MNNTRLVIAICIILALLDAALFFFGTLATGFRP